MPIKIPDHSPLPQQDFSKSLKKTSHYLIVDKKSGSLGSTTDINQGSSSKQVAEFVTEHFAKLTPEEQKIILSAKTVSRFEDSNLPKTIKTILTQLENGVESLFSLLAYGKKPDSDFIKNMKNMEINASVEPEPPLDPPTHRAEAIEMDDQTSLAEEKNNSSAIAESLKEEVVTNVEENRKKTEEHVDSEPIQDSLPTTKPLGAEDSLLDSFLIVEKDVEDKGLSANQATIRDLKKQKEALCESFHSRKDLNENESKTLIRQSDAILAEVIKLGESLTDEEKRDLQIQKEYANLYVVSYSMSFYLSEQLDITLLTEISRLLEENKSSIDDQNKLQQMLDIKKKNGDALLTCIEAPERFYTGQISIYNPDNMMAQVDCFLEGKTTDFFWVFSYTEETPPEDFINYIRACYTNAFINIRGQLDDTFRPFKCLKSMLDKKFNTILSEKIVATFEERLRSGSYEEVIGTLQNLDTEYSNYKQISIDLCRNGLLNRLSDLLEIWNENRMNSATLAQEDISKGFPDAPELTEMEWIKWMEMDNQQLKKIMTLKADSGQSWSDIIKSELQEETKETRYEKKSLS